VLDVNPSFLVLHVALTRHMMPQPVCVGVVQLGFTIVLITGTRLALGGELTVADAVAIAYQVCA
jgi:hypothetical protein